MKICPKCGAEFEDDKRFCENCGSALVDKSVAVPEAEQDVADEDKTKETAVTEVKATESTKSVEPTDSVESVEATEPTDPVEPTKSAESTSKASEAEVVCPNCGQKNAAGARFCESCGQALQEASHQTNQPKPLTSAQKKRNTVIVTLVVLIVALLFGGYNFGENYYSRSNQIKRYQEVLQSTDADKFASVLTSSDDQFKVTKDSIKVYSDYLKNHQAYLKDLTNHLGQADPTTSDIYLQKHGKHFLFFDKYELMIQPVYFNVNTNVENMALVINDKKEENTSDADSFMWALGPFAPGEYVMQGTFDYNGEKNTVSQTLNQVDRAETDERNVREVSFDVTKVKVNFVSDIKDGEILVDDQPIAKLDASGETLVDTIWREDATLTVKQKLGNAEIVSNALDFYPEDYLSDDYSKEASSYVIPETNFSVYANVAEATVNLNDQKIGTLKDGELNDLVLVDTDDPLSFQAIEQFDDGSTEKTASVDFYYDDVYLDFESEIDDYDLETFLDDLYLDVSDYTDADNEFGDVEAKSLATYFEKGTENAEYLDFKDNFIQPTRDSGNKAYIIVTVMQVESLKKTGKDTYEAVYDLNYYTTYEDDTEPVDQYFRYKKATFVVNEDGDIMIRDLGGKDNFEEISEREAY